MECRNRIPQVTDKQDMAAVADGDLPPELRAGLRYENAYAEAMLKALPGQWWVRYHQEPPGHLFIRIFKSPLSDPSPAYAGMNGLGATKLLGPAATLLEAMTLARLACVTEGLELKMAGDAVPIAVGPKPGSVLRFTPDKVVALWFYADALVKTSDGVSRNGGYRHAGGWP